MENIFQKRIQQAKKTMEDTEYILLGGGAGLSAAAGIEYGGKDLQKISLFFMKSMD